MLPFKCIKKTQPTTPTNQKAHQKNAQTAEEDSSCPFWTGLEEMELNSKKGALSIKKNSTDETSDTWDYCV